MPMYISIPSQLGRGAEGYVEAGCRKDEVGERKHEGAWAMCNINHTAAGASTFRQTLQAQAFMAVSNIARRRQDLAIQRICK